MSSRRPTSNPKKQRIARATGDATSLSLFEAASDSGSGHETASPEEHRGQGEQGRSNSDSVVAAPARTLWEGETRLDATTAQLISQLSGLRWPRKWSAIRRFDLLVSDEIARLGREAGDQASPWLIHKIRGASEIVELSAKAEEALVAREGGRGFRRVLRGESGATREYFIKRITTADGFIETRLSWFGAAWPLFEEASAKIESGFQAFLSQSRGAQRSLFEELDEAERERADSQLRLMESVRNGRLVLDYLVRTFGRDGTNPVRVAAWDLKALLGCEGDAHAMRRVRGCLEALGEIRFEMHLKGGAQKARSFGALISEVQYSGAGAGDHGDGWFQIHLAPSALGCLAVFGVEAAPTTALPRTIAPAALELQSNEFNWKRSLSPAELQRLQSGFTRSQMSLAPHYDRAHDLSPSQAALLRWIEKQLTQERDPSRFKSTSITPGDRTPRLYGHIFCSALPQGRTFLGALGHFRDRPERGRKLSTLAKELGLVWPSARAKVAHRDAVSALLSDLRLVVEDVLGGLVVLCLPGQTPNSKRAPEKWTWQLLGQESHTPEFLAAHGTVLPFISPDYLSRLMEKLENYYQERFERGETPYLIRVRRIGEAVPREVAKCLNEQLKNARINQGLTQAQVARILGVSQVMIAKWERNLAANDDEAPRFQPISPSAKQRIEDWLKNISENPIAPTEEG